MYQVDLDDILDIITSLVYDEGHGFLYPTPSWVVPAESLLDELCDKLNIPQEIMAEQFDKARQRVHGVKNET